MSCLCKIILHIFQDIPRKVILTGVLLKNISERHPKEDSQLFLETILMSSIQRILNSTECNFWVGDVAEKLRDFFETSRALFQEDIEAEKGNGASKYD